MAIFVESIKSIRGHSAFPRPPLSWSCTRQSMVNCQNGLLVKGAKFHKISSGSYKNFARGLCTHAAMSAIRAKIETLMHPAMPMCELTLCELAI